MATLFITKTLISFSSKPLEKNFKVYQIEIKHLFHKNIREKSFLPIGAYGGRYLEFHVYIMKPSWQDVGGPSEHCISLVLQAKHSKKSVLTAIT